MSEALAAGVASSASAPHLGPSGSACEGPAFPLAIKLLAGALVLAVLWQGGLAFGELQRQDWPAGVHLFLLLVAAGVLVAYASLLQSRTRIDASHIRQTGLWSKEVALADVVQVKFIYLPYLSWLLVPRLVLKLRTGRSVVVQSADVQVLRAFARLTYGALWD
ncbi:hypothetical protein [Eleftheria terrae]|uniref:hypothetical protein n=1 Tax=Eleftheria terrae TaxID=1597781 RepID=UPI00263BCD87|nr:hypothetical protein [Eleftheria terrae]WKB50613.1 hypothetical protein N7L95_12230 [Eleftheria terrae]